MTRNYIYLLIFCMSCTRNTANLSNVPLIEINPQKACNTYLEEVATNIECHNLQITEDQYFGDIIDIIPTMDSLLLFHDYYNKQIYLFNTQGKFINLLNRVGRGPGEYLNIEAFTANKTNKQLILYDHLGQKLVMYHLPDLKYIKQQKISKSLMSLTALSEHLLFTISDEAPVNASVCDGAEIYDIRKNKFTPIELPNHYVTVNLSYPRCLSFTDQKNYYICPHLYSIVYKLDAEKISPVLRFHFGDSNIPEALYTTNDANKFEEAIESNEYALLPQYFLKQDSNCFFCFRYGNQENPYWAFAGMDDKTEPQIYREINIKGITTNGLKPAGVIGNRYICLLYPHLCRIDSSRIQESTISQEIAQKLQESPDEGTPVMLMFQPKRRIK